MMEMDEALKIREERILLHRERERLENLDKIRILKRCIRNVCEVTTYELEVGKFRTVAITNARRILYWHLTQMGYGQREIAKMVNRTPGAISQGLILHEEKIKYDIRYSREFEEVKTMLEGKRIKKKDLIWIVANTFGILKSEVISKRKKQNQVNARYFIAFHLSENLQRTNSEIAKYLDIPLSYVDTYLNRCDDLYRYDPMFKKRVQKCLNLLNV